MQRSHKIVYTVYVLVWIIMAINPRYRQDWLLENILVFLVFPLIVWMDTKYRFTLTGLILLLVFASLHSLGAHFTYAKMEYFDVITQFFGFERNNFDRVVHFLFGLLTFRIIFEMIMPNVLKLSSALLFTFTMVVSISALYEILEWLAAIIFHPELGLAFLGTQGDIWDSQKDTLVAMIGALINLAFYKNYKKLLDHTHTA